MSRAAGRNRVAHRVAQLPVEILPRWLLFGPKCLAGVSGESKHTISTCDASSSSPIMVAVRSMPTTGGDLPATAGGHWSQEPRVADQLFPIFVSWVKTHLEPPSFQSNTLRSVSQTAVPTCLCPAAPAGVSPGSQLLTWRYPERRPAPTASVWSHLGSSPRRRRYAPDRRAKANYLDTYPPPT